MECNHATHTADKQTGPRYITFNVTQKTFILLQYTKLMYVIKPHMRHNINVIFLPMFFM